MSLFRIGGAAGLRATRLVAPVNARFASNVTKGTPAVKTDPTEAPAGTHHGSSLINKQSPADAMTRHHPDYEATIDHGTSYATLHSVAIASPFADRFCPLQTILPGAQACDGWQ